MERAKMAEKKQYEIPTLDPDDIEVKVKQVGEKGTVVLLYKTSRTDMRYLDEIYGPNNWQVDYQMIGDMLFCTISVWDEEKKCWIKKQSNGVESRADGEGNEKKGQASDAMKRSGFLFGIGRELYSAPFTYISASKLPTKKDPKNPSRWVLDNPFTKLAVSDIGYDDKRRINKLVIVDKSSGEVLYTYGLSNSGTAKRSESKQKNQRQEAPKQEEKPFTPPKADKANNAVVSTTTSIPQTEDAPEYLQVYRAFLKRHGIDKNKFAELRLQAVQDKQEGITDKSFKELTGDEWMTLIASMEALYTIGYYKETA